MTEIIESVNKWKNERRITNRMSELKDGLRECGKCSREGRKEGREQWREKRRRDRAVEREE